MQSNNGTRRLYVGMHDGVCTVSSADGGKTWQQSPVQPLEHAAARLSASSSVPARAFLAAYEAGLYRTDDGGETWKSLDAYPSDYAHSVLVHPLDEQLVYAGSEPASLFRSQDGGESWEECAGFSGGPRVRILELSRPDQGFPREGPSSDPGQPQVHVRRDRSRRGRALR